MTIVEKLLNGEELRAEEIKAIMEEPDTPEIVDKTLINANMCYKTYDVVIRVLDDNDNSFYYRFCIDELHDGTMSYYRQKPLECFPHDSVEYLPTWEEN